MSYGKSKQQWQVKEKLSWPEVVQDAFARADEVFINTTDQASRVRAIRALMTTLRPYWTKEFLKELGITGDKPRTRDISWTKLDENDLWDRFELCVQLADEKGLLGTKQVSTKL
jgi:hypothetical protein